MQNALAIFCDCITMRVSATNTPSSVICCTFSARSTKTQELLDIGHGVARIRDKRPSPVSPLSSSSSVRRHSRSAVPPTSSGSSTTREHPLLIGSPVAGVPSSIPSQAEEYPSLKAVRRPRACQPRSGMCSLQTSTSTQLRSHIL